MTKNYLDKLYNPDDILGVKMFGLQGWNRLKGAAAGYTEGMLKNPAAARPSRPVDPRYNVLLAKVLRPDIQAGAELLGESWFDSASNFLSSNIGQGVSSIGHGVANILSNVPYVGGFVKAGRQATNFAADALNALGFGTGKTQESVKKAAISGGVVLLVGGGVAVYLLTRKKKRGRR